VIEQKPFHSSRSWLLGDHLGSTSMVTDASGVMVSETRYSAFGETRYQNGTLTTDHLYTGQRQEAEIGLYYYVARWYDPAIGRFIQADSIVPDPGSAVGYDRFAYAANNPVKYIDPSGHWYCDGYEKCKDWVDFALLILKNNGGDYSSEAYNNFFSIDGAGRIEVKVKFTSSGNGMATFPPNITLKGIGNQISVKRSSWVKGKDPSDSQVALFAHEISHLNQNPLVSASVIGELLAYETQYQVLGELSGNYPHSGALFEIHNLVNTEDIYSSTLTEQNNARKLILNMCNTCNYEKIPYYPGEIPIVPKYPGGGDVRKAIHFRNL